MAATTKTASRSDTSSAKTAKPLDNSPNAGACFQSLPDVSEWIKTTFWSGDGPAVPPGVVMMRANPLFDGFEKTCDSVAQTQAEIVRFAARRVHRALEAQADMLACRSSAELRDSQEIYMRRLAEDYAHEWNRLFSYGMRMGLGQPVPPPPEPEDEQHATPV